MLTCFIKPRTKLLCNKTGREKNRQAAKPETLCVQDAPWSASFQIPTPPHGNGGEMEVLLRGPDNEAVVVLVR